MELKVTSYEIGDDGVATVWLKRPGRGNSWTGQMNVELRWIMAQLETDPAARVIIITGHGNQFCVGADTGALEHYKDSGEDYAASLPKDMATPGHGVRPEFDHDLVWQWGMRTPIIAAMNGACAGVACTLVAFSDLRYAASGSKFTTAAPRLGLPAEYGLSWVLPRLIGLTHAADLLITGRIVLAEELLEMGFLNGVFPRDEFLSKVHEIAAAIASGVSTASMAITKRQLYGELLRSDVGAAVEESKRLITDYMKKPDYKEGVAALLEKRPPKFPPPEIEKNKAK
ncbi:MAG TPA: enoyl-CoA hydratase-related protein [Candidatus Binataceae bacterium]|nr:enoyl-CoA hydratase-related protein [Candidatus Binataceae bacterium]